MTSLLAKWQRCGKPSCRCSDGLLHGPYFWLVTYISKKSTYKKGGKYSWVYLGKNPRDVWEKLERIDSRFENEYDLDYLNAKIKKLERSRDQQKTTEKILTVENSLTGK
ncbi:MAG: hypothetical protein JSV04_08565 [Candidatus Heimdallarchaeota archaeon]|nr:MAG: hypothetical protein JSV04_08565 [Candidatus Heimdallarchaeota archaeon]